MNRLMAALAALTVLRLLVAALVPLSPDEAYYWVWSRALAPGYLDHPPLVALCIRAGTALLGENALGVRLLSPLLAAAGSVLLARAANDLLPAERPGRWAAALLNATLFLGVGGVLMTPDTPLMFFWTLALWAMARLVATGAGGWWLLAGLASGLALASKYTAALLPAGVLLWLLLVPSARPWLRRWQPWAGAALGLAAFAPVLAWNAAHGWASFLKQGARVEAWQPARALGFLAELLGGQLGLATPLVFLLCAAGLAAALRRAARSREPAWTLLACLSVPAVVVFAWHALGDRVQGNWPAVIYPAAAIAAAGLTVPGLVRLRRAAVALGFALTLAVYVQAVAAPLRLSIHADPTLLRLAGWRELAAGIAAQRRSLGAAYVAADNYGIAAELAWWLPKDVVIAAAEPRWALFNLRPLEAAGETGLLVSSARRGDTPDPHPWVGLPPAGTLTRSRDGIVAETFTLYRVVTLRAGAGLVSLPRPR